MKTLLSIGVLSVLFVASSLSEARSTITKPRARDLKGAEKLTPAEAVRVQQAIDAISNEFFSNPRSLEEVYVETLRSESLKQQLKAQSGSAESGGLNLLQVTTQPSISKVNAQAIIGVLESKAGALVANKKADLMEVITSQKKPNTALSLKRLADKIANNEKDVRSEDVAVMLEFVANTKRIAERVTESENAPESSNIVLDLAQHIHDIVTWPASSRGEFLDLARKTNEGIKSGAGVHVALTNAFASRGYDTTSKRLARARELREKCRR